MAEEAPERKGKCSEEAHAARTLPCSCCTGAARDSCGGGNDSCQKRKAKKRQEKAIISRTEENSLRLLKANARNPRSGKARRPGRRRKSDSPLLTRLRRTPIITEEEEAPKVEEPSSKMSRHRMPLSDAAATELRYGGDNDPVRKEG